MEESKEIMLLCRCGYPENDHYCRHLFDPKVTVTKYSGDKDHFVANANDWETKTKEGKCSFPQCSAGRPLHGPIIKHEYTPKESYKWRSIFFRLPLNTRCRVCKESLEDHESLTHAFTTKVEILNKTEHDIVTIKAKDEQTIVLED